MPDQLLAKLSVWMLITSDPVGMHFLTNWFSRTPLNESEPVEVQPDRACPPWGSNSPVDGRPPAGAERRRELNNCRLIASLLLKVSNFKFCLRQLPITILYKLRSWVVASLCVWRNQMLASKICENHHFILLSVRIEWNTVDGLRAIGAIMVSSCRKVTWTKEDPACNWKIANNDDEGSDVTTARELNQVPLQSTWQVIEVCS